MIILLFGLPGSGKSSLAEKILEHADAIHLNADAVRADLSSDLGFSVEDRIEQARRLGAMARLLSSQGKVVVVDFVNPTDETRKTFGDADLKVWINRIDKSRYEDTNSLWQAPTDSYYDLEITSGLSLEEEKDLILEKSNLIDWKKPTTLMLGRYQPWHEGHQALKDEAHLRTNQVFVAVRDTQGTSEKDPLIYEEVRKRITEVEANQQGTLVMRLPNITNIVYGRDVGYLIEKVELSQELQAISATQKRKELGI
jgi:hypothetical protein